MGIAFSPNASRMTVREALTRTDGRIIVNRLQAGRVQQGCTNRPHRLTDDEIQLVLDEEILVEVDDCYYASFVKPTSEICKILNRPELVVE